MKKIAAILLSFIFISYTAKAQSVTVAFGSCADQEITNTFWNDILSHKPDVWVWGGDNIYADTGNPKMLRAMYKKQMRQPGYLKLTQSCKITGTWDDHDYGTNDGGKFFAQKQNTKKAALNFLKIDDKDTVYSREGLYSSTSVKNIRILNLDTRYFRDTLYKYYFIDSLTQKKAYGFMANTEGDILGEQQWQWLENELLQSKEKLIIINSSVQVIARDHRWEKWGNFPNSLKRLYALLAKYPDKRILFISGDRHIAEISSEKITDLPYPVYDFTSSGLTHTWDVKKEERNRFRIGALVIEKNYGLVRITETDKHYAVTLQVWGEQKKLLLEENVLLSK